MKTGVLARSLLDFFFPRFCAGCGQPLAHDEQWLCSSCILGLPWEYQHEWERSWPMTFVYRHPTLQRAGALLRYTRGNIAAHIIHQLKYHHHYELGQWMGRLAVRQLQDTGLFDGVDTIVPIPLAKSRRRSRGFNQTEIIAQGMADELKIVVHTHALRRIRDNESQTHFRFQDRLRNAVDIFDLDEQSAQDLAGHHVMVIDDVMTTGRTMFSAIEQLERIQDIRITIFAWAWKSHPLSSQLWAIKAAFEGEMK